MDPTADRPVASPPPPGDVVVMDVVPVGDLLVLLTLDGRTVEFCFVDDLHELLASLLPPLPSGRHIALRSVPADGEYRTGGRVWHCAPVFCNWLRSASLHDACVLELGSGTGACGLFAAGAGARRVVLTDGDDRLLELLECNRHRNQHAYEAASVEVLWFRWTEDAANARLPNGPFDLLIGSDVIYDPDSHEAMCATLTALLSRDAERAPRAVLATMPRHRAPTPNSGGQPRRAVQHPSGHCIREASSSPNGLFTDAALIHFLAAAQKNGLLVTPLPTAETSGGPHPAERSDPAAAAARCERNNAPSSHEADLFTHWPQGFAWTAREFQELSPFLMSIVCARQSPRR